MYAIRSYYAITITQEFVDDLRANLPELPDAKKKRFLALGLSMEDVSVLIAEKSRAEYFEKVVAVGKDAKLSTNWLLTELLGALNKVSVDLEKSPVSAEHLGELVALIADNTISGRIAKDVFAEMFETGKTRNNFV